ncbi:MAG: chemotaxis protein CheA [Candidatus Methylomirabilales bacterium]
MSEDRELIQAFMEEAGELVEAFEQGLLELEASPGDPEVLNRIFRAAHTIKGNSGMLGFTEIAHFTHALEDVLDRLRKGRLQVTAEGMTLLLRSLDMLKLSLHALVHPGEPAPDHATLIADLARYAGGGSAEGRGPRAEPEPRTPAPSGECRVASDAGSRPHTALPTAHPDGEDRPRLGEILVAEQVVTTEQVAQALAKQRRLGEILVDEQGVAPDQIARALGKQAAAAPRDTASIRVHTDKVDKLVNLVGEMVITQSMLTQAVAHFTPEMLPRLTEAVAAMERHSRELQERVMAVRMQPMKAVFGRFSRFVRDLAQSLGKQVRLEVSGEETELDKTVIDRIGDPLTHLVRNAVDHGVEAPAARLAAGKPEQGVVRLHAYHQGGSIFIEVEDDGKGLDRTRIRRKALEAGLLREEDLLSEEETCALIFRPGFSTAETITDVSGRGVGMDVVRRTIEALGGHVGIRSQPGRGSRFTIKLPLTLAILDGLSIRVGTGLYILPLVAVAESIRPRPGQVRTVAGRGEVLDARGRVLPVIRLYQLLGVAPQVTEPTDSLLVIVDHNDGQVGFLVDEVVGQQQVVIKSLEANYRRVEGVSGATITGDGQVALILDIPELVRMASRPALGRAA